MIDSLDSEISSLSVRSMVSRLISGVRCAKRIYNLKIIHRNRIISTDRASCVTECFLTNEVMDIRHDPVFFEQKSVRCHSQRLHGSRT
jgi:hypothetical protein